MRTLVVCLLVLFLAAHAAQAEDVGNYLERGTIERWGDAPRQLLLWADAFEDIGFNYALNFFVGIAEVLAGTILISHGRRQLDFANPARGKGLSRVANRTAGEVVKTVLGHILRLVGIARGAAGLLLGMAHLF